MIKDIILALLMVWVPIILYYIILLIMLKWHKSILIIEKNKPVVVEKIGIVTDKVRRLNNNMASTILTLRVDKNLKGKEYRVNSKNENIYEKGDEFIYEEIITRLRATTRKGTKTFRNTIEKNERDISYLSKIPYLEDEYISQSEIEDEIEDFKEEIIRSESNDKFIKAFCAIAFCISVTIVFFILMNRGGFLI